MGVRLLSTAVAAGTAVTNTIAETVAGSYVLQAGSLQPGKVYKLRATVRATATNATDTLTTRVRFGPTTLTGTALFTSAATDVANDKTVFLDLEIQVRTISTSGVIVASGLAAQAAATGGAVVTILPVPTTGLDLTATQRLEITVQWSVANAGNSCQVQALSLLEIV